MIFRAESFYDGQYEHRAIAAFDSHGALCYCNHIYRDDFSDIGRARLRQIERAGGRTFLNAQEYSLFAYRPIACGIRYEIFSLGPVDQSLPREARLPLLDEMLSTVNNYISAPVVQHLTNVASVIDRWSVSSRVREIDLLFDGHLPADRAIALCSPGALACALTVACRLILEQCGDRDIGMSLCRDGRDLCISIAAGKQKVSPNGFLTDIIAELGARGGFSFELSAGKAMCELRFAFAAASVSGVTLTARDLVDIDLAARIFSML